jgi:hypothetical protein
MVMKKMIEDQGWVFLLVLAATITVIRVEKHKLDDVTEGIDTKPTDIAC